MKKKGFTLVELLAVIVILAIILAVAIPGISNVVKSATKGSFENDAKMVLRAIEYKEMEDYTFDPTTVNEENVQSLLGINDSNYQSITTKIMNDKMYITIVGKNMWANLTASGTKSRIIVTDTVTALDRGANIPVLAANMKPIKWDTEKSTWVETTTTDSAWYNYDATNKIWANARTADGSMWVWIPRYIYKIPITNWHTSTAGTIDIQFTKGVDDNWNKASIGAIDVEETANASNNKWTNHPAFTFGDSELTGIWVAKFEATASEGVDNGFTSNYSCPNPNDDTTIKTVKILPNVISWRCISVSNAFLVSRNMETNNVYGWGTSGNDIDTHMITNTEWGATAYLSKSIYGQNINEIWINPADNYTTGCAGNSTSSTPTTGCLNAYNTTNGVKASTTGNIYGVYDMSGGAWERMAAYLDNGHANLMANGGSLVIAEAKYKDVYMAGSPDSLSNNYALAVNNKGDAVYETSSTGLYNAWFNDSSVMPQIATAWFGHGGNFDNVTDAGPFNFHFTTGNAISHDGFRPALVVGSGL